MLNSRKDWIDVGLHVGITLVLLWLFTLTTSSVLALTGMWFLLAAFWLVRELSQHGWSFGGPQSQVEWIAPTVVGLLFVVVV